MSYRSTVLSDYPLAYYPLDDLTTTDLVNFGDILANFETYQDVIDNFSSYANIYGDIAYDNSGCNNHGNYIGDPIPGVLPILIGNGRSTRITIDNHVEYTINKDYSGITASANFGKQNSSDANFTLELWVYPKIYSESVIPLLGDSENNVGIFFDNGNILFKLNSEELSWTIPHLNKVMHIACVYTQLAMYIYVDGELKSMKNLINFEFSNLELNLKSGPTAIDDHFLINSVAVYRYALNESQIKYHNSQAEGLAPIQIVYPDNGELFEIQDDDISTIFKYSYPANKNWTTLVTDDLYYNPIENSLQLKQGTVSEVILEDYISIPGGIDLTSSKIEWMGDNGISIQISTDGVTYTSCINGNPIPGYTLYDFSESRQIYLKIIFSSNFPEKFLPKLFNIIISFYNNQILYSSNGTSYLQPSENSSIGLGRFKNTILNKDSLNGIRVLEGSSFNINTINDISTLEFFYEKEDVFTASGLLNLENTYYFWDEYNAISSSNISSIYVNGQDVTDIFDSYSIFMPDSLCHVIINFSEPISGNLILNSSPSGSSAARYQNIALYESAFTPEKCLEHYNLYIYRDISPIPDDGISSFTMTENSLNYYDSQWTVIQNS